MLDLDELKQRIIHTLDVVEFLDILGLEFADIIDLFDEHLEENYEELIRACR
jgi:hypothetical protein